LEILGQLVILADLPDLQVCRESKALKEFQDQKGMLGLLEIRGRREFKGSPGRLARAAGQPGRREILEVKGLQVPKEFRG
jgi:hypothetical protein